jgi:hypothetical protein
MRVKLATNMPLWAPKTLESYTDALVSGKINQLRRTFRVLENFVAPQEYIDFADHLLGCTAILDKEMNEQKVLCELRESSFLQLYERHELTEGAYLYRFSGGRERKTLLIVFSGNAQRPGMPMPMLLQRIDARAFDVLMLQDSQKLQFRKGLSQTVNSFGKLANFCSQVRRLQNYSSTFTLGTSAGGFPAIRIALAIGAERAFSFGGQFPNDSLRILRGQAGDLSAYDPICACLEKTNRPYYYAHGLNEPEFGLYAKNAAALTGGKEIRVDNVGLHALLGSLWAEGRLDTLLSVILGEDFPSNHTNRDGWSSDQYGLLFFR